MKGKLYIDGNSVWEWVCAIVCFLGMYPYFLWEINVDVKVLFLFRILQIIIVAGFIFGVLCHKVIVYKKYIPYICFLGFYYIYTNYENYMRIPSLAIKLLMLISILLIDINQKKNILIKFTFLFALSLIPGIIVQLINITGGKISYEIITLSSGVKAEEGVYYKQYWGAVEGYRGMERHVRLCGMFDEPGVVGTMSGLLLAANRKRVSWIRFILFIGGVLSISFAFFVIYGCCFLLTSVREKKFRKLFGLIFLLVILFFILSRFPHDNLIYRYTLGRIGFANGKFIADNRTSTLFDIAFKRYLKTTSIFFGVGKETSEKIAAGISSYKSIIFKDGIIIFCLFLYLIVKSYNFFPHRHGEKRFHASSIFLFVFMLSIYQRPNVINYTYMLVLYGGIACLEMEKETGRL